MAGCTGRATPVVSDAPSSPTPSPSITAQPQASPSADVSPPTQWRQGAGTAGFDVSRYQRQVDWTRLVAEGHHFVYVKSTEGSRHISPTQDRQRADARAAGLLLGGYHYARPGSGPGHLQARFFVANGGGWQPDGRTLPGALDLEFNDSGERCYGLTPHQMGQWVRDFSQEYQRLTGRVPVIYTKTEVWQACTGGDTGFGDHPLWLYDHAELPGALPAGWEYPTLWQRGVVDQLDRNVFFGSAEQLSAWAASPVR